MKRSTLITAAIAALLALTTFSCGKDEAENDVTLDLPQTKTEAAQESTTEAATEADKKTPEKTTAADEKDKDETKETEAVTDAPDDEPDDQPGEQPGEEPDDQPGENGGGNAPAPSAVSFDLSCLNANAASYIAALGTPNDTEQADGCLSNGADQKIYYYDGITVSCYVMSGAEYIYDITITGTGYSTSAGIYVGSSRSDVQAAYGPGNVRGTMETYNSGESMMGIDYNGDTVKSITFYTPV